MRNVNYIYLILICYLIQFQIGYGQSDFQKTVVNDSDGIHSIEYLNGTLLAEYETLNGKLIGIAKFYNRDGSLAESQEYQNGKLDGKSIINDKNGRIDIERIYSNDSIIFERYIWYLNDSDKITEERIWKYNSENCKKMNQKDLKRIYNYANTKMNFAEKYGDKIKHKKF